MTKPILVVTSRHTKEVEYRIDRDYNARRNPNQFPFSQQKLLSAAEGADALFITPADRLDSGFFQKVSPTLKIIATGGRQSASTRPQTCLIPVMPQDRNQSRCIFSFSSDF